MISMVKQISVFIENKVGHLAAATDILAKNDINILALFVYDSQEYAILRLIVDKPYETVELFRENGKVVRIKDVMVIERLMTSMLIMPIPMPKQVHPICLF